MKQVYSYQEIGTEIDRGTPCIFTCHPQVRVTCIQKQPDSEIITVTLIVSVRDTCVGIMQSEYASITNLLDAFDIDDQAEIWEVFA